MSVRLSTVDSEDAADLIVAIERDFGICYHQNAFDGCQTVGEIFDIVWDGLPQSAKSGGKCPSLMTFHLLKAYLLSADITTRFTPDTSLKDIVGFSYIRMQRDLLGNGWKMPLRQVHPLSLLISALLAVIWGYGLIQTAGILAIVSAIIVWYAAGLGLHRFVFTKGYPSARTLGELATEVSHLNVKRLLSRGASFNRSGLWKRFQAELEVDGYVLKEAPLT